MIPTFQIGQLGRTVRQGAAATDPYFANVSLLLHCNGANGSTSFPDSSVNNHTLVSTGCQVTTTTPKYGTGAASFATASSSRLVIATPGSTLQLTSTDFTIETWVWVNTASTATGILVNKGSGTGNYNYELLVNANSTSDHRFAFRCINSAATTTAFSLTSPNTIVRDTWYHVAATKSGSAINLWVNGSSVASATSSDTLFSTTANVSIGAFDNGALPLGGKMDDIRITKGVARYTATFTPPIAEFPNA
jgi:hypothetical protein